MDFSHPVKTRSVAKSRGFTLIELMVVVIIIGILAAIAMPQIAARMRERRANQAAQQIALVYRNARLRAMGRGFAVLVSYNSSGTGEFRVLETLPAGGLEDCIPRLPPSCTTTNWAAPAATRLVERFNPTAASGPNGIYSGVVVSVTEPSGSAASTLDLCFSPRGRAFSRVLVGSPLQPMTGVIDITVGRAAPAFQRHINVLPNGMARVAL